MAKNILLHIMDILKDTDELNQLKRKDLENRLKAIGIENVDRHTIRKCIDTLNDIGMDIAIERGRENSYYLRERIFEEWEIKLISDMVSECVFLSKKDSTKLIEKLERFTGIENRKLLNETSLYRKKSETINSNTKLVISDIIRAIIENKKITFQYCDYDNKLDRIVKEKTYTVSPYKCLIKNGHYYLILNKEGHDDIAFYRVDRITNVQITTERRRDITSILGRGYEVELNTIIKRRLYSYDGENIRLVINVKRTALGEIIDNFSDRNIVLNHDEESLTVAVNTCKSEGLYYWLMQHLETVRVVEPEDVRNELIERIDRVMKGYGK